MERGTGIVKRKRRGPVSAYQPEIGEMICTRMAAGETLRAICLESNEKDADGKFIHPLQLSLHTIRGWLVTFPEFNKLYKTARDLQAHGLFDEIIDLAHGLVDADVREPGKIYKDREVSVAVRTLQWAAGRLLPATYGEHQQVKPTVAVQINTTLELEADASAQPVIGGKTKYVITVAETAAEKQDRVAQEGITIDGTAKEVQPKNRRARKPKRAGPRSKARPKVSARKGSVERSAKKAPRPGSQGEAR